jgi:MFS family permease
MPVFVIGRVLQGIGHSGLYNSSMEIASLVHRTEHRSVFFRTIGSVYLIGNLISPLLGGTFAHKVSWRWCFYLNLPLLFISAIIIVHFVSSTIRVPNHHPNKRITMHRYLTIDWIGSLILAMVLASLLLPLQWGGITRPWNNWLVILLLVTVRILF